MCRCAPPDPQLNLEFAAGRGRRLEWAKERERTEREEAGKRIWEGKAKEDKKGKEGSSRHKILDLSLHHYNSSRILW